MRIHGTAVSRGYAVGKVFVFRPFRAKIAPKYLLSDQVEGALSRFQQALADAEAELDVIVAGVQKTDPDKAAIFDAHRSILKDEELCGEILEKIKEDLLSPEYAVELCFERFIQLLSANESETFRERCADLKDVKSRLQRVYLGIKESNLARLKEPVIIVANDLYPSDTVTMKREMVLGIATEVGGFTSHSAILARSYGIPALCGVSDATEALCDGQTAVLDAEEGVLLTQPSGAEVERYRALRSTFLAERKKLDAYKRIRPVTKDGVRVEVSVNIGDPTRTDFMDLELADGIGLFRTEFLYMRGKNPPGEREQEQVYRRVIRAAKGKPVLIRTLDVGGDKKLAGMEEKEPNPFLGLRAVRYCFVHEELFLTQLRALLRAGAEGPVGIMFPMVSSMEELARCKEFVERAKQQLRAQNVPFDENIRLGVVVEVPALPFIAREVAAQVDFASIGTNDLCQYTLAVDRLNPRVSSYYQSFHPAVLRAVKMTADAFQQAGKPLSVCGEMAGETAGALLLIGLGIRRLSMNAPGMAGVKKLITNVSVTDAQEVARQALGFSSAEQIEAYLQDVMRQL